MATAMAALAGLGMGMDQILRICICFPGVPVVAVIVQPPKLSQFGTNGKKPPPSPIFTENLRAGSCSAWLKTPRLMVAGLVQQKKSSSSEQR